MRRGDWETGRWGETWFGEFLHDLGVGAVAGVFAALGVGEVASALEHDAARGGGCGHEGRLHGFQTLGRVDGKLEPKKRAGCHALRRGRGGRMIFRRRLEAHFCSNKRRSSVVRGCVVDVSRVLLRPWDYGGTRDFSNEKKDLFRWVNAKARRVAGPFDGVDFIDRIDGGHAEA